MAAAMSLELGLYSSWKEQMLKEYERLAEMKRGLLKQKQDQALPQGLGTALPVVRSASFLCSAISHNLVANTQHSWAAFAAYRSSFK